MVVIDYERVNWQNSIATPLGARNQNKMDKGIKDIADYLNKTNEYTLMSSGWASTGNVTYPYVNNLSVSDVYADEDYPLAQVWGMNDIETAEEITSISYVKKVIVGPTGIKVYASNRPTVNLKLVLKL